MRLKLLTTAICMLFLSKDGFSASTPGQSDSRLPSDVARVNVNGPELSTEPSQVARTAR
jgi:hypothetical protein